MDGKGDTVRQSSVESKNVKTSKLESFLLFFAFFAPKYARTAKMPKNESFHDNNNNKQTPYIHATT